jgi:disulfide bond formation protein DsbB
MPKKSLLLLLFLLVGMLLIGCGGDTPADNEAEPVQENTAEEPADSGEETIAGDSEAGKTHFDSVCIACHGADATGVVNLGKDLTTSEFVKGLSDQELVDFIKTGRSVSDPANTTGVDMPPKGGNPALSDQDLLDIVAYLRTLEK